MERFIPIIVAVMLVTPAFATEVLVNGGFETGLIDPWTFDSNWSVVTTDPHSGTYCALGDGNHHIHQEFTPVPVDEVISLSIWLKQPNIFHFKCRFYYGPDDFDQTVNITVPNGDWNQYDLISYLRPTGDLEAFRVYGYLGAGSPDYTYLDDASINDSGGSAVKSASLGELKAVFH